MPGLPPEAFRLLDQVGEQFSESGKPVLAEKARKLSLSHVRPALGRARARAKADQVPAVVVGSLVIMESEDLASVLEQVSRGALSV